MRRCQSIVTCKSRKPVLSPARGTENGVLFSGIPMHPHCPGNQLEVLPRDLQEPSAEWKAPASRILDERQPWNQGLNRGCRALHVCDVPPKRHEVPRHGELVDPVVL